MGASLTMANRYAGTCYKCGNHCAPGDGVFEKVSKMSRKKWPDMPFGVRWQTQHHECVRDYARDAHYIHNPQMPLVSDAKYKPSFEVQQ